jgi:mRNA interferase RelE/StbE
LTWTVRYTETAAKAIKKLDPTVRERVRAAIDVLREDPHRGKPLQLTLKGLYSWRTGDWRMVYRLDGRRIRVIHATLGHRREVYDRLRDLLR